MRRLSAVLGEARGSDQVRELAAVAEPGGGISGGAPGDGGGP